MKILFHPYILYIYISIIVVKRPRAHLFYIYIYLKKSSFALYQQSFHYIKFVFWPFFNDDAIAINFLNIFDLIEFLSDLWSKESNWKNSDIFTHHQGKGEEEFKIFEEVAFIFHH